jgi:hypothetical protein
MAQSGRLLPEMLQFKKSFKKHFTAGGTEVVERNKDTALYDRGLRKIGFRFTSFLITENSG